MNKIIVLFASIFAIMMPLTVQANTYEHVMFTGSNDEQHVGENVCKDASKTMRFVGYIILMIKVLVPLVIIIMGSFDFAKAVTGNKGDEDIKKGAKTLGRRMVAGVIIFLVPTILNTLLNTISEWANYKTDYLECTDCLFSPTSCTVYESDGTESES